MLSAQLEFLAGGGEMGARMRALDWSSTPLGVPDNWPQSLRSTVSMLLPSRAQICLFWGSEFTVLYNDAYRPCFGAKHPHALGRPGREAWSEIWDNQLHGLLDGVMRTGEAFWARDLLFQLERHGFPEETYFDVSYDPVRIESGAVGGVYCIVTETTERVIGERRLRLLRDLAARNATARTARDACVLAMDTLAGSAQDIAFAIAYLGDDLQSVTPGALERLAAAPPGRVRTLTIPTTSGPAARLVVGLNPRRPFDDQYRTFVELVADQFGIALANARAHEDERQRAEALAAIDRAKTAFFSNVSHEFRTPLTLLLGPIEEAVTTPGGGLRGADLETAYRNGQRLLKLVNTLLDFSRIEAGRARAMFEPTDLATLTRDLASAFRSATERAGIRLLVDCPPLPELVCVDRDMWEKIVLNLISNAFKFTWAGSIAVTLDWRGSHVTLEVRDTGVGIAPDDLPRVFDRFHRIDRARARTHEGSGIGLALVRELAAIHGGSVTASSEPGRGSTFSVSIPTGSAPVSADPTRTGGTSPEPDSSRPQPAAARPGAVPYVQEALRWLPDPPRIEVPPGAPAAPAMAAPLGRVLVADDNADMREYIARLLADRLAVDTVSDGALAFETARSSQPDAIVADIMMPGLDGLQLIEALRRDERTRAIPVILVSARAGEEARLEGLESGADDYLVKPFSSRELISRVHAQVARGRTRAAERAEAARLARVFDHAPVGVAILGGPDHVFDFANRQYLAMVGHRDIAGKPAREALPEVAGQGLFELLDEVFTSGTPHVGRSMRALIDRGGAERDETFFDFVYQPLFEAGAVTGIAAVCFEVTELANARREAELANRAKDEFLAMLGHELRNPLAPILTALQLMDLRGVTGADRERRIIERQVRHVVALVDDLLDVSRITRGKVELHRQSIHVNDVIARAIEIAAPVVEERQHTLVVDVPAGLAVEADPARLAQVFANLLNNAAKYTDPRGTIRIDARRAGGQVEVTVSDDGSGIAPEMLPHVFELFVQERQDSHRAKGGLGIGLAIVRSLVQAHGGRVRAASAGPNRGSTFTVTLPSAMPVSVVASARSDAASEPAPGRRLLLVDDNQDAASLLADSLRTLGHEVAVAHDGPAALETVRAFQPEAALLDIGLPVMDGFELADRLRHECGLHDLTLIAITGYAQEVDRQRTAVNGFEAHLAKPIDVRQVDAIIRRARPGDRGA